MPNFLNQVVSYTRERVNEIKPKKSLKKALASPGMHVIAEIKRSSPSKGEIAQISDPVKLAQRYASGKASALSVLTSPHGFNGSLNDLQQVSHSMRNTAIPILRKDFIIDPIQIFESIYYGADAVLLIVAMTKDQTAELLHVCKRYHIDAIVEVHNSDECDYAISIGAEMIGINNRDLSTLTIDTQTALQLKKQIPSQIITIAESGIKDITLAHAYRDAGFNALLIGEHLVRSNDPEKFIQEAIHES